MSQFNLHKTNDLIPRLQTYVLDRKLITIHSNDRDVKKWPFSNNFEVELPETISNVQSVRIVATAFPSKIMTFSNEYQNTKMSFRIIPEPRESDGDPIYIALVQNLNNMYTIEIQEGSYTPQQLCLEIMRKMNHAVDIFLMSKGITDEYNYFALTYDEVGKKIFFGNTYDNYVLEFGQQENYSLLSECKQPIVWNHYTHWGLPYYIGYQKISYIGDQIESPFYFDYRQDPLWIKPLNTGGKAFFSEATYMECLKGDSVMYMEIDKLNSMGEIVPYSDATSNTYNNDYNGTTNAAFEKIPLSLFDVDQTFDSRNMNLQNMSHYETPIETIRKLKFRFRFHDGRLVNFQNCDFNFTIAFNCLKDEIPRQYELRIPATYNL